MAQHRAAGCPAGRLARPGPAWRSTGGQGGLQMADERERWALILGASSGMGQAAGLAFARAGYRIAGVHLDFRAGLAHVEEVKAAIVAAGSEALIRPSHRLGQRQRE